MAEISSSICPHLFVRPRETRTGRGWVGNGELDKKVSKNFYLEVFQKGKPLGDRFDNLSSFGQHKGPKTRTDRIDRRVEC